MVRKSVKITVCTMAAVMAFSGMNITANAAASSSVLPSGTGTDNDQIIHNFYSPFVQCSSSPMEKQVHLCYTRFTGF